MPRDNIKGDIGQCSVCESYTFGAMLGTVKEGREFSGKAEILGKVHVCILCLQTALEQAEENQQLIQESVKRSLNQ